MIFGGGGGVNWIELDRGEVETLADGRKKGRSGEMIKG